MPKNRLFEDCVKNVHARWGRDVVDLVGIRIYEALLYREVFLLCVRLDDSVDAERIRRVMNDLWHEVIDHINELQGGGG